MIDRRVIVIVLLLAIYVLLVKPMSVRLEEKVFELRNIERQIAKEKFIERKSSEIKKIYPEQMSVAKRNLRYFFPANIPVSTAMSSMQSTIKRLAKLNAIKIMSMNWGVAEDAGGYLRLPISFRMQGYPDGVAGFVKGILTLKKLMRFDMYSVTAGRKKLSVSGVIVAYKLKSGTLK